VWKTELMVSQNNILFIMYIQKITHLQSDMVQQGMNNLITVATKNLSNLLKKGYQTQKFSHSIKSELNNKNTVRIFIVNFKILCYYALLLPKSWVH